MNKTKNRGRRSEWEVSSNVHVGLWLVEFVIYCSLFESKINPWHLKTPKLFTHPASWGEWQLDIQSKPAGREGGGLAAQSHICTVYLLHVLGGSLTDSSLVLNWNPILVSYRTFRFTSCVQEHAFTLCSLNGISCTVAAVKRSGHYYY